MAEDKKITWDDTQTLKTVEAKETVTKTIDPETISTTVDPSLQELQARANTSLQNPLSTEKAILSASEKADIEANINKSQDFKDLATKITEPVDKIIDKVAVVIDNDPVMDVSKDLENINNDVQAVYKEIINTDSKIMKMAKSIPLFWKLVQKADEKADEAKFNMKSVRWKIDEIFSGFDISYTSLNKSIDMQKEFLDWLEENLGKVKAYKEYIAQKLEEFKVKAASVTNEDEKLKYDMFIKNMEYFLNNMEVLVWNLELARKRLLIRLDSAVKLYLAMNWSRPIFKTLLNVAVIETSGQKALEAAQKAITTVGWTIDKMSSDLTDRTIQASKTTEQLASKPALSTQVFVENVNKLKKHFEEIEAYQHEVALNAQAERAAFNDATKTLQGLKEFKRWDIQELQDMMNTNPLNEPSPKK